MNENLFRPQFDALKLSDKLRLMQTLATRYHLTFKELYAFSRWGQSCTTGVFEKAGREFVFVPGDTVTLGWESFAQGMDKANLEELAELFAEIGYEGYTCVEVEDKAFEGSRSQILESLRISKEYMEQFMKPSC